jgi:hypothetical protein
MTTQTPEDKFEQLLRTDEEFQSQVLEIGAAFFHNITRDGLRRGDLCLTGKTHAEIAKEVCDYVRKWADSDFTLVDDHRPTLLEEARRAATEDRLMIATVLYATFFEHTLNDLVLAGCARSKLDEAIAMRLVRASSVFDKTGDLLADIGLPPFPSETATIIRKIAELRNEFVHYKWIGRRDEEKKDASGAYSRYRQGCGGRGVRPRLV